MKNSYIKHGIIVWDNGSIDISPKAVYEKSYVYEQDIAM